MYTIVRNESEKVKKEAKEAYAGGNLVLIWRQICRVCHQIREGGREVAYAIKVKNNELLTQLEEIGERWRENFDELLNVDVEEEMQAETEDDPEWRKNCHW